MREHFPISERPSSMSKVQLRRAAAVLIRALSC